MAKEGGNVDLLKGKEFGSPGRPIGGMGDMGLYNRKKKKKETYSRQAPNYQASTGSTPGDSGGGE